MPRPQSRKSYILRINYMPVPKFKRWFFPLISNSITAVPRWTIQLLKQNYDTANYQVQTLWAKKLRANKSWSWVKESGNPLRCMALFGPWKKNPYTLESSLMKGIKHYQTRGRNENFRFCFPSVKWAKKPDISPLCGRNCCLHTIYYYYCCCLIVCVCVCFSAEMEFRAFSILDKSCTIELYPSLFSFLLLQDSAVSHRYLICVFYVIWLEQNSTWKRYFDS